jgi:Sec-independent protein translocase protein TatA
VVVLGLLLQLLFYYYLVVKKIPELMKGLGGGIKEFKKASKDEAKEELEEKK